MRGSKAISSCGKLDGTATSEQHQGTGAAALVVAVTAAASTLVAAAGGANPFRPVAAATGTAAAGLGEVPVR